MTVQWQWEMEMQKLSMSGSANRYRPCVYESSCYGNGAEHGVDGLMSLMAV